MKTKKVKLHYTMKSLQSQVHSEFEVFAIKEVDGNNVTYIYKHEDVKTWVCIESNSIALLRLDEGFTAVWLNDFQEGLAYKSSQYGAILLHIKGADFEFSDDFIQLQYHIVEGETIMETITQTWEVL